MTIEQQLAIWIKRGLANPVMKEVRHTVLKRVGVDGFVGNVFGVALVGKIGDAGIADVRFYHLPPAELKELDRTTTAYIAGLLGLPIELAETVEVAHSWQELKAIEIAERLWKGEPLTS